MKTQPIKATAALALGLTAGTILSAVYSTNISQAAPRRPGPVSGAISVSTTRPSSNGPSRGNSTTTSSVAPRPSATPGATPAPHPTPVAGSGDIRLLEGALSRTLTDSEKAAITTAAATRDAAIRSAMTNLDTQVATAVGLTVTQLQTALRSYRPTGRPTTPPDPVTVLEDVLDRELTDDEVDAVELAFTTRDAAIKAAMDAYRNSVAASLNISLADLDAAVQAFLDANRGPARGRRPGSPRPGGGQGGKPGNCSPPAGSTNTGATGGTTGNTNTGTTPGSTTGGGSYY